MIEPTSDFKEGRLRGAVGLVILAIIMFIVLGWWQDYLDATRGDFDARHEGSTSSSEPTASADSESTRSAPGTPTVVDTEKTVIVLVEGLNLRSAPSRSANSIKRLQKGEKLAYIGSDGGWHQVRDADGTVGYVSASERYSKVQ